MHLRSFSGLLLIFELLPFLFFVSSYKVMNETGAMQFLERFGYVAPEDMPPNMGMDEAKPMLMAFQRMCNINMTGVLDSKTMEMMNAPRCGNLDMVRVPVNESDLSSNRIKRYMLHESGLKWQKREVTFKLGMYSQTMQNQVSKSQALDAIKQAFDLWQEVTNLDFIHTPNAKEVDIELSFTMRFHMQDQFPFDGPGTTLAHAFPPGRGVGGDVHFEDEETWTVNSPKGSNVLYVAVHEIGHALGLSHSSTKGAIMGAYYGGYRPVLKLHPDDIEGIQALYGKRQRRTEIPVQKPFIPKPTPGREIETRIRPTTTTTTRPRPPIVTHHRLRPFPVPTTTPAPTQRSFTFPPTPPTKSWTQYNPAQKSPNVGSRPDLCSNPKIDAITTLSDGEIYVFKDAYVFQVDSKGLGVKPGWPHHVSTVFQGLEPPIDAAVTRQNGKTYFFKGRNYWRFSGRTMDPGYPKEIIKHFAGIPAFVESAFIMDGQIYFTKGDKFWRFDPKTRPHVDSIYPLPIEVWGMNTYGIDAAFLAPNKEVYFFKDRNYWKFDWRTFKIAEAIPPYPRASSIMWFGCGGNNFRPDSRNIREGSSEFEEDTARKNYNGYF